MAATTTMRVSPETRDRLTRLARERGRTNEQLLDDLVTQAEGRDEVAEWLAEFEALPPEARSAYREEADDFDALAGDGLSEGSDGLGPAPPASAP